MIAEDPPTSGTFHRTATAEHVLWKAQEISLAHSRGEPVDDLRLCWARSILAANSPARTLGQAREGASIPPGRIRAALRATGDL